MTRYLALLENGDRVSRDEFERRYQQMPNLKNAGGQTRIDEDGSQNR